MATDNVREPLPEAAEVAQSLSGARRPNRLWRFCRRRPLGVVGLAIVLAAVVSAVGAPLIAPYNPTVIDVLALLHPPSAAHLLGTDQLGHDVLSEIIYGSRVSLTVAFGTVVLAGGAGGLIGLLSGYFGGWLDNILMRLMDAIMAFPGLVLALVLVTALGGSVFNVTIAIAVTALPIYARLTRGQVLVARTLDYVEAARAMGAGRVRVMVLHIAPNVLSVLIIQSTLNAAVAILTEASLSFLGLGVPPPTPTWGGILQSSYGLIQSMPWVPLSAGGAIFVTVLGLTTLGSALRDLLDPQTSASS